MLASALADEHLGGVDDRRHLVADLQAQRLRREVGG
jgi:hypothetical protein